MASLLANGYIKKQIAKGFKGRLLVGTLRKQIATGVNDYGDPIYGGIDYAFTGIRENFDAAYQARALIPQTDVKILLLLGSIKPNINSVNNLIVPAENDNIYIQGIWHNIRRILEIDPAGASASAQAYQIGQSMITPITETPVSEPTVYVTEDS